MRVIAMSDNEVEINVTRYKQGNVEQYVGVLSANLLCGDWGIEHIVPDKYDPLSDEGYQRNITITRARDFAKYVSGGRASPTALRLNVRDLNVTFKQFPNMVDYGRLTIPETSVLYVVDGQHRLEGLRLSYKEKVDSKENFEFEMVVIITKFSKYEEAVDFAVTNKTQKGLKTDLTDRILRKIMATENFTMRKSLPKQIGKDIEWRSTATLISDLLNSGATIWKNRIIRPNAERTSDSVVTETTLVSSLEPIINTYEITDSNARDLVQMLDEYWLALNELCPHSISEGTVLMKTLGTGVMHKLFIDVLNLTDTYYGGTRSEPVFKEILENAGEYMQDKFWQNAGIYGSSRGSISTVYRNIKEAILSSYYDRAENKLKRVL